MNKRGRVAAGILVVLITIAITSAAVFLLVQKGVIEVKEAEGASILNMEFIPYLREGYLVIKEFKFCSDVDGNYECVDEKENFRLGDDIHFRFVVESSTSNGEVMLVENYQVKGPAGNTLLEVDERDSFYFETKSQGSKENIYFKDYLVSEEGDPSGEYTLELIIENPLLNKKVTLTEKFKIV